MADQCEAVSQDKWACAPHAWRRCRNKAHFTRDGLEVCRVHRKSRLLAAFSMPEGERPHWRLFQSIPGDAADVGAADEVS